MTERPQIILASGNQGKLDELRALLGPTVRVSSARELGVTLPEETGTTFAENATLKARAVTVATGQIAIADDSGLVVEALNGAPGVYSARYSGLEATDEANIDKLLVALTDVPADQRQAYFATVIAIAFSPDEIVCFDGRCTGSIGYEQRGSHGFGYDSVFVLPSGQTMAEIPPEEKNRISHRANAMRDGLVMLRARLNLGKPEEP